MLARRQADLHLAFLKTPCGGVRFSPDGPFPEALFDSHNPVYVNLSAGSPRRSIALPPIVPILLPGQLACPFPVARNRRAIEFLVWLRLPGVRTPPAHLAGRNLAVGFIAGYEQPPAAMGALWVRHRRYSGTSNPDRITARSNSTPALTIDCSDLAFPWTSTAIRFVNPSVMPGSSFRCSSFSIIAAIGDRLVWRNCRSPSLKPQSTEKMSVAVC